VAKGNRKLFDDIEAFGPNVELITKEAVVDGAQLFVAYVPHSPDEPVTRRNGKQRHTKHHGHEPNPFLLLFWFFLLFCILLIAMWKTQWTQWSTLYGLNSIQ